VGGCGGGFFGGPIENRISTPCYKLPLILSALKSAFSGTLNSKIIMNVLP
jgi:hypothetical protein